MASLADLKTCLDSSKKIAIFSHTIPDADAFCSTFALKAIIEANYKDDKKIIDIFIDYGDEVAPLYAPIVGDRRLNFQRTSKYDLAIALDSPQTGRFQKYSYLFDGATQTVNIDHHSTNANFAGLNYVYENASSTGEVVYQIAKKLGLEISLEAAKNVFTSIITDTVCLTQSNVSKNTYKILAELSAMDFDQEEIKNYFFKNNTKAKTLLLEKAISSIKFYEEDKIAIMKIQNKDLEKLNATQEDTLGIVEHANNIDGVVLAAIIIERAPNQFYVSLRSKGEVNITKVAEHFGGGGHSNMAAFQSEGELSKLSAAFVKEYITALNENESKQELSNEN
ncbi:MAG: bifunctional oligoribonuclease/PAP phosphatase NrnA [Spirochaetales bacterium]